MSAIACGFVAVYKKPKNTVRTAVLCEIDRLRNKERLLLTGLVMFEDHVKVSLISPCNENLLLTYCDMKSMKQLNFLTENM